MPTYAGQMILAGDIQFAVRAYERAGRGARGWEVAVSQLRERHPDAHGNSINAVIERAQETVAVGNRYRQGRPSYSPLPNTVPDVRYLEYPYLTGSPPAEQFRHVGTITLTDPTRNNAIVQSFGVEIQAGEVWTREQFEAELHRQATAFLNKFVNYDRGKLDEQQLGITYRIGGVFRGF